MKYEVTLPYIEGEIEHDDDGFTKSRSLLFWDKQLMKLYYQWVKDGNNLNPNVRIALESPE